MIPSSIQKEKFKAAKRWIEAMNASLASGLTAFFKRKYAIEKALAEGATEDQGLGFVLCIDPSRDDPPYVTGQTPVDALENAQATWQHVSISLPFGEARKESWYCFQRVSSTNLRDASAVRTEGQRKGLLKPGRPPDFKALRNYVTPTFAGLKAGDANGNFVNVSRALREERCQPSFVIDTGYSGYVILPWQLVAISSGPGGDWTFRGVRLVTLADGTSPGAALYQGTIEWPPLSGNHIPVLADVLFPYDPRVGESGGFADRRIEAFLASERGRASWPIGCYLLWPGSVSVMPGNTPTQDCWSYVWHDAHLS